MSKAPGREPQLWCVLPAAGSGTRFAAEKPKQYMMLGDKPLIVVTLERLLSHPAVAGVIVALAPADHWWPGLREICGKPVLTVTGGATRAESVLAAVRGLPPEVAGETWIAVHDAARPGIRHAELDRLFSFCFSSGLPAILALPVSDTIKRADGASRIVGTIERENLWRAQTPQCAPRAMLQSALEASLLRVGVDNARALTDEAKALEEAGATVCLVEGHESNLKVTTALDLDLARFWLSNDDRGGRPGSDGVGSSPRS